MHSHTHSSNTHTTSWPGSRGGGIPSSLAYWNPPFLSLSHSLSLCVDLYLCISKPSQSAPTNSISCGRPLPNFPLLYSSLSLFATITLSFLSPASILSSLSDIDFYLSSLAFLPLLPLSLDPHFVLQASRKADLFRIIVIPHQSHSVSLLAMPVIQNISYSTPDSFTVLPPFIK